MIRRPRRTAPAVLTALVLLAICVAVAVSLIQRLTGSGEYLSYDSVARELHAVSWDDVVVPIVAVIVAVIGALLLVAAVVPGRTRLLPVEPGMRTAGEIDAGVHRADLRALLRGVANSVEGVHSARVAIRRDTATVSARTDQHRHVGLADEICAALSARIQQAGRPVGKVRARLRGPKPTARDRRHDRERPKTLRRSSSRLASAGDRGAPATDTWAPGRPATEAGSRSGAPADGAESETPPTHEAYSQQPRRGGT